jgi:hypothetical protein
VDPLILELAGKLKGLVKDRLSSYLSSEQDKKEFLEDRTKRMAELTLDMAKAQSDDERTAIRGLMSTVADTIETELIAIAVDVSAEFRASVSAVLETVLDYAEKALPIILRMAKL